MATNSDGGIVLSVNIDSSEVSSDMKKVVSEINKQVQAEAKNIKAVESVNQAKEKTAQQQAKTNQAVYNEVEAEYKALTAEQNLATAKEKSAIVSAKKTVEEEKGYRALVQSEIAENNLQKSSNEVLISEQKLSQEKEKSAQAVTQSEIKQQKLNQEINNSVIAEEKKNKAILDTQKKQQDLLIGEQKLKKAIEDRAIAEEKHKQAIIKTEKAQKSLKNATNSVTTAIKQMATQLGIAFSLKQIINFSKEAGELASQTEAYLTRMSMLYGESAQEVYDWANANSYALGMAKSTAYEAAAQYGNLFTTFASAQESAKLSIDMLQATAVVASQTGRTYEETFEKIQSGIYGNTRAIDDLGISVRQNSLEQTQAWQTVSQNGTKSWNDLTDAELQQLRVLGIIEQSTAKYGNTVMQTTALTRAQFNAAWTDFKATWGSVVNGVLIPILQVLTKIINAITTCLSLVAKVMGKSNELNKSTVKVKTDVEKSKENQDKFTDSIKDTNKELKKTLAGFDELQILQDNTSDSSGTSGVRGSTTTIETEGEETQPDDNDDGTLEKKVQEATALLGSVMIAIGGSLAAIGLILLMLGNIPWGIGFLIAGAAFFGVGIGIVSEAFDSENIQTTLITLTGAIAGGLAAVGLILLFLGSIPWGIGFIIGGAAFFSVSIAVLTDKIDTATMKTNLERLEEGIGLALCAVGLILMFVGQIGWGIGFLIAGAYLYNASQQDVGDTDKDATAKTRIQQVEDIVGDVLIAIGLILLFVGQIGFAIGFIVVGATLHSVSEHEEGETDVDVTTRQKLGEIMEKVAEALIAVGLIMIFLGQITWGLGYIVTGAGLFSVSEIIPSMSPEEVKENCDAIISFLSSLMAYLITKKLLENWTKFVGGWGDFKALCQLIAENGFFKTITELFGKSLSKIQLWAIAIGVIVGAISYLAQNWDKLSPAQRVVTLLSGLATAATAAAIAVALFQTSWSVGIAAAAIAGGIAILAGTYLFKKNNANGSEILNASGEVPESFDVSKYAYLAKGENGSSYKLPALAKGAVIPANHEFLAVLGDQKHGTNIEAPAELIKQMAKEAYQEMGLVNNQQQQIIKEEHYNLNQTELMTIMYKLVKGGERLNGTSLVKQGGI